MRRRTRSLAVTVAVATPPSDAEGPDLPAEAAVAATPATDAAVTGNDAAPGEADAEGNAAGDGETSVRFSSIIGMLPKFNYVVIDNFRLCKYVMDQR